MRLSWWLGSFSHCEQKLPVPPPNMALCTAGWGLDRTQRRGPAGVGAGNCPLRARQLRWKPGKDGETPGLEPQLPGTAHPFGTPSPGVLGARGTLHPVARFLVCRTHLPAQECFSVHSAPRARHRPRFEPAACPTWSSPCPLTPYTVPLQSQENRDLKVGATCSLCLCLELHYLSFHSSF